MGEKRKPPAGCYWRGETLWGRFVVAGKEFRCSLRTNEGKIAAGRLADIKAKEVAARRYGDARTSWEDAVAAWGESLSGHTKPATRKRYMVSLVQLEPFVRDLYIDQVDKALVSLIVARRRAAGVTNATIRRDLTALSSVLSFAEDQDWRTDNPALARLRKVKERRDPIVLPEPAHIEAVIAIAPGRFADLIRVAWLTGCRQDELRRMEHQHLDFTRSQISVYKTKTGRPRVIEMRDAEPVLAAIPRALGTKAVFWHSGGRPGARVAPPPEPYLNIKSNFRRLVLSAQKTAQQARRDFRPFRFHDLRHRFAVEWLKSGGGIYELSRHLGHTSVKTTEIYLAYLTGDEADAARKGVGTKSGTDATVSRVQTGANPL